MQVANEVRGPRRRSPVPRGLLRATFAAIGVAALVAEPPVASAPHASPCDATLLAAAVDSVDVRSGILTACPSGLSPGLVAALGTTHASFAGAGVPECAVDLEGSPRIANRRKVWNACARDGALGGVDAFAYASGDPILAVAVQEQLVAHGQDFDLASRVATALVGAPFYIPPVDSPFLPGNAPPATVGLPTHFLTRSGLTPASPTVSDGAGPLFAVDHAVRVGDFRRAVASIAEPGGTVRVLGVAVGGDTLGAWTIGIPSTGSTPKAIVREQPTGGWDVWVEGHRAPSDPRCAERGAASACDIWAVLSALQGVEGPIGLDAPNDMPITHLVGLAAFVKQPVLVLPEPE
jgi:hypothetical protein